MKSVQEFGIIASTLVKQVDMAGPLLSGCLHKIPQTPQSFPIILNEFQTAKDGGIANNLQNRE